MRLSIIAGFCLMLASAYAQQQDTVFRAKRMKEWNEGSRDGRCIIRVMLDDEDDIELNGDTVRIRVLKGGPGRDDGTECTQPMPRGGFTRFSFKGIDGRGEVRLVQEPRPGNAYTAIVAIKDSRKGTEGYTFELSWTTDGSRLGSGGGTFGGGGTGGGILPNLGSPAPSNTGGYTQPAGGGILPSLGTPLPPKTSGSPLSGMNETRSGNGTIRSASGDEALRRMRVYLKSDGTFELQAYSSVVTTLAGRWSPNGSEAASLDISQVGGDPGSGTGRIYLNGGRLGRVEVDGQRGSQGVALRFDAQ